MPTPTLAELIKTQTKEDVLDKFVSGIQAVGIDTTAWQSGEPVLTVLAVVSEFIATWWNEWAVPALRAGWLDFAEGPWLTASAAFTYGVTRREETRGVGKIRVKNTSGSSYTISPGDITIKNENTGHTHTNTTGGFLPSSASLTPWLVLSFQADESGDASNTLVTDIAETPTTAPAGVLVDFSFSDNTSIVGQGEETDEQLRNRCRLSNALSPVYYENGSKKEYSFGGPMSAYESVALKATYADGTPVEAYRVKVVTAGSNHVKVYLAGPSGPTPGDMFTPNTGIFRVYTDMLSQINTVGTTLSVFGASTTPVGMVAQAWINMDSGITKEEAESAIYDAIGDYMKNFPIGGNNKVEPLNDTTNGWLYPDKLNGVAEVAIAKLRGKTTDMIGVSVMVNAGFTPIEIPYNAVAAVVGVSVVCTLVSSK